MAQPPEYVRQYDFEDFQASNPTTPLPADQIEAELNAVKTTSDAVRTNLALIQRDDTALANQSVHVEALNSAVRALIALNGVNIRGDWATATAYAVGDVVISGGSPYLAFVAHTSGVSIDLTKFVPLISDLPVPVAGTDDNKFLRASGGAGIWTTFTASMISDVVLALQSVITAANVGAARTALGVTAAGDALLTAAAVAAQRTAFGATATGTSLFTAADAAAARLATGAQQNVMTAQGDIVIGGSGGAAQRLALGTTGQVLQSSGTQVEWGNVASGGVATNVTDEGVVGDGAIITDAAITAATTALTSATAAFTVNDVGKTVAIEGAGAAGAMLVTTIAAWVSATEVTLTAAAGTTVSGATMTYGTDNATALNTLIASKTKGALLFFPEGFYIFGSTIDMDAKTGIVLLGASGACTNGNQPATRFCYVSNSGTPISMDSSIGCGIERAWLSYASPSITGSYVVVTNTVAADAQFNYFNDMLCYSGSLTRNNLTQFFALNKSINTSFTRVSFIGSGASVRGREDAGYANVVRFYDCQFAETTNAPIQRGGEIWSFRSCTFEGTAAGLGKAFESTSTAPSLGLAFRECWFGDVTTGGGTWINLVQERGLVIAGCMLGGEGVAGSTIAVGLNAVVGFSITGNFFNLVDNAVTINGTGGATKGGSITGNAVTSGTTVMVGTPAATVQNAFNDTV